jgi:MerR family transcriptional regulator, mercuric resistance operon regulatory protein
MRVRSRVPTDGELAPRQHYPPLLLGLARGHDLTCAEVKALTEQHIADIRDLRKLDRVLSELAGKCRGSTVPDCPILDALQNSSPAV